MKTAYIFPGQGSQFSGMARNLYENSRQAREMFEQANEILDFRITDLMFGGTAEDLKRTDVTQPAVFLHSVILAKTMGDFAPDMVAGHSLGEFSALAAAGAVRFEDALRLVAIRAVAMQKACGQQHGTMAAIMRLEAEKIEEICAGCKGIVVAANYNSPAQTVISGEVSAVEEACARMKEAGAGRTLILPVGGAFHSPLMEPARAELAEGIRQTTFNPPICPVYQNVTAEPTTDPELIRTNLLLQLTSPVKWTQTIRKMVDDGASRFIETGPGKVLQGLVRSIGVPDIVAEGRE